MSHMVAGKNIGLIATRQTRDEWHVFSTRLIIGHKSVAAYDINSLFPLYLYLSGDEEQLFSSEKGTHAGAARRSNLAPDFTEDVSRRVKLAFISDGQGDLKKTFGPEDVFHYMYAVFHSPTYRTRYAEFLRIDFPRLPLTSDRRLFGKLCVLGAELVSLHLMESPKLDHLITNYPVAGDDVVEKGHPKYLAPGEPEPGAGKALGEGRVYISRDAPKGGRKGQYFEGVAPEVWEFHVGGYQVCEKWLKARRGRKLSHDDLINYQKIVGALKHTLCLMAEIDEAIPAWPMA